MRPPRLLQRIAAAVALCVLLAACQVDGRVEIDVADDGSGTIEVSVALDDAAVARAGDLSEQLSIADMEAAGWGVVGPAVEDDGLTWVRATKAFEAADQVAAVSAETGVLRDVRIERSRSFSKTDYEISGLADVTGGIERFGDDDLAALLGGRRVGIDLEQLEAEIGPIADATSFTLVVRMPEDDDESVWTAGIDDPDPLVFSASSSRVDQRPRLWAVIAGALMLLFFASIVFTVLRIFARRDEDRRAEEVRQAQRPAEITETPTAVAEEPRRLELVVLDAMGVLFDVGDDVGRILVPFVEERGGTVDAVHDLYRILSLGRMSTAEFWVGVGLEDPPEELDADYADRLVANPAALVFLERAQEQGTRVAVLANGVGKWMQLVRKRYDLDRYVELWLISGEMGVRKPDIGSFEALRRVSGVSFRNCLMIDDRLEHLDSARQLGMSTAWFDPPAGVDEDDHPPLRNFAALTG